MTSNGKKTYKAAAEKAGGSLVAVTRNPVDAVWTDRPPPPAGVVVAHDLAFAGEDVTSKLKRVCDALAKDRCAAVVVSDSHNLSWLFNIRGGDVGHTPLVLGYALAPLSGEATVYIDAAKIDQPMRKALSAHARIAGPARLQETWRRRPRAAQRSELIPRPAERNLPRSSRTMAASPILRSIRYRT